MLRVRAPRQVTSTDELMLAELPALRRAAAAADGDWGWPNALSRGGSVAAPSAAAAPGDSAAKRVFWLTKDPEVRARGLRRSHSPWASGARRTPAPPACPPLRLRSVD